METTVKFGNREIARLGLGTNRLTNASDRVEFIRAAVDAGIQMIDTAHLYTGGESERAIGSALSPHSASTIVATKGGFQEASADGLRAELAQSLASLQRDRIDLYYLHRLHPGTSVEHCVEVLKEFQDQGKIDHIGLSQVDVAQIARARKVATVAAVQNHYNISEREHDDVVDYCTDQQIVFVPFFPLRGEGGGEVAEIAETHNATKKQIALAWLLRRSLMMLPIPGTLSLEHLHENLKAFEINLTDAEFEAVARRG